MATHGALDQPMLASIVRGLFEAAVAAGVDRAALLRRIELEEATLLDANAMVPGEAHARIWEALGELPHASTLAVDFTKGFRIEMFGVVGWVMQNAPTAGDTIRVSLRYQTLFGDPFIPAIDDTPDAMIIHKVFPPRLVNTRVATEYTVAASVWLMRELAGLAPRDIREVWFQHDAPGDPSGHDAYFGSKVRWNAPETRLVITREGAERPITKRNAELFAYLEKHATELEAKHAAPATLAAQVRALVLETLKTGEPSPAVIAKKLALSERTLQRRLKDEDTTFADILDDVRRDLAVRYLGDPKLAIFEIAFLLGYAETSPFTRAFKRWTNETPADFRANRRLPAPVR